MFQKSVQKVQIWSGSLREFTEFTDDRDERETTTAKWQGRYRTDMKRNTAALVVVACFAIIVIGVAASSLASTPVHSGFGIDVGSGSGTPNNTTSDSSGSLSRAPPGGSGIGIFASGGTESSVSGSTSPVVILGGLLLLVGGGILLVLWATTNRAG